MAEAASDHSDSKRTVDDLFQLLVHTRGKSPSSARRDILKQLQDDGLPIDLHIKGGVRSSGPVRKPTPKARLKAKRTGIVAKARYSTTPRKGVTLPVDPQSWEDILLLRIRGEKLVIKPGCAFDYPWDAYSFTVANWSLVEELWPNPNQAAPAPKLEDSHASSATPAMVTRQEWWDVYLTPERKTQLDRKYKNITEASRKIEKLMAEDHTIEGGAYKPRVIEKRLRNASIFPPQPRRRR